MHCVNYPHSLLNSTKWDGIAIAVMIERAVMIKTFTALTVETALHDDSWDEDFNIFY